MNIKAGIGDRLREERERTGLNQAGFGKLGAVSRATQAAYENDKTSPDVRYLAAVQQHGVDVDYILTGIRGGGDVLNDCESGLIAASRLMHPSAVEQLLIFLTTMVGGPTDVAQGNRSSTPSLHSPQTGYRAPKSGD